MLSWRETPERPSVADLLAAHALLLAEGGGVLRTTAVRAGDTRFATPAKSVASLLEDLVVALRTLSTRDDLTPVSKAAWAAYNFLSLHPFRDGNGRMARGLANMMLARSGVPFVVGFAASDAQRKAYRDALVASHRDEDVRPFAAMVRASVARGWAALEQIWVAKRAAAISDNAGAQARAARDDVRRSDCLICLDEGPTFTMYDCQNQMWGLLCTLRVHVACTTLKNRLCCGGAYHIRCLTRWLQQGTACAQCRAPVPTAERRALQAASHRPSSNGTMATNGAAAAAYQAGFVAGQLAAHGTDGDDSLSILEDDTTEIVDDTEAELETADDTEAEPETIDGTEVELGATADDTEAWPETIDDTEAEPETADDTEIEPETIDDTETEPETDS